MKALEDLTEAGYTGSLGGSFSSLPTGMTAQHTPLNPQLGDQHTVNYTSRCCWNWPRKATCLTVLPPPTSPPISSWLQVPKIVHCGFCGFYAPPPCDLKDSLPLF